MAKKVPLFCRCCKILLMTAFAFIGLSCAGRMLPSGGPVDTTPPAITLSVPEPGAIHSSAHSVKLEFSKYINRRSLEESVFFSPNLGALTFDWGSTDVEIRFADSLRPNTTTIMTIGTDFVDTHGNHLAKAFSLPFTTGDKIDSGAIAGTVVDSKPDGIMIYAWRTSAAPGRGDTLNPSETKPDYLTQTSANGSFILPYLAMGTYRVIAVKDEFKNLLYDVQTDQYGIPTSDILLTPGAPQWTGVTIRMTTEDTTFPYLSSAKSIDKRHVLLRFSKAMDVSAISEAAVAIADTLSGKPLPVLDFAFLEPDYLTAMLVTAPQESLRTYRVVPGFLRDTHGLPLKSLITGNTFTTSTDSDTGKPVVELVSPVNQTEEVQPGDSIHFAITEPVVKPGFEHAVRLADSAGTPVPLRFYWKTGAVCFAIPDGGFRYGKKYKLDVVLDSVVGYGKNRWKDSTHSFAFGSILEDDLSSLEGDVSDSSAAATGAIFITATNISHSSMAPKSLRLIKPGSFVFDKCLEGLYTLSVFRDADSSGKFSYGKPFPFRPSERFVNYPDTLKLRARWPMEGIHIRLR
jgi:hypothetical protein